VRAVVQAGWQGLAVATIGECPTTGSSPAWPPWSTTPASEPLVPA
jgi:hypothetical protein